MKYKSEAEFNLESTTHSFEVLEYYTQRWDAGPRSLEAHFSY